MKVYIVVEVTWDHHINVAAFSSFEKAEAYCDSNYIKKNTYWTNDDSMGSYDYFIEIVSLDETS